jgi:mannosyltransferase
VAVNRSSIPEVAGNAGILIDESDPELIAAAIETCAMPDRRLQLLTRGFAQAEKFSWDKTFAETVSIYQMLISERLA